VFLDLVAELKRQGLGNKVIADMFGMALRTYHERVQRLAESASSQGRSLWEAVLTLLQERRSASRSEVLAHFQNDDERTVRSVLADLVDSGLAYRTGRGDATSYRAADPSDLAAPTDENKLEGIAHWVHLAIARSEEAVDRKLLEQRLGWSGPTLDAAVERLAASGRIEVIEGESGPHYSSPRLIIPFGAPAGWETAVFDHFQTMVTAVVTKLRNGARQATPNDAIGGSTYRFELWRGHPQEQEVLGLLASFRRQASVLRSRVVDYNRAHAVEAAAHDEDRLTVSTYVGQNVRGLEEADDAEQEED
jgi:DNA-binding IscR family transcriptional regulator